MKELVKLLKQSKYTVVLTGAGMSTESGLKDFRSTDGMWKDKNVYDIARIDGMTENPELFTEFYRWRIKEVLKHEPNAGHYAIDEMMNVGYIQSIITQNVDGYHRQLASKSSKIIELHGDIRYTDCSVCEHSEPSDRFLKNTACPKCGSMMRPSIVMFDEMLDQLAVNNAFKEASKADLLLVIGTSLSVSPASHIPLITRTEGGKVVLINKEPVDFKWDISIIGRKAGDVLTELYNSL
jgi:NAD-dependent deacetylase